MFQEQEKAIKNRLNNLDLSNKWLQARLFDLGINVDMSSLSNFINGNRTGKRSREIIAASQAILDDYEKLMSQSAFYSNIIITETR